LLLAAATDTFFTHAHAKEASQPASVHQQPERGSCLLLYVLLQIMTCLMFMINNVA
jgi:hypothetical protein